MAAAANAMPLRLPATYAAVARVLAEVRLTRPDFAPDSLLDAGSGPGTASWAAAAAWPAFAAITMFDAHAGFLALAGRLAMAGAHPAMTQARLVKVDILTLNGAHRASLVAASYALAEISPNLLDAAVDRLLLAAAVPVAPCPHTADCPMTGADWCHFAVRLPRSRAHMHAKQAQVPFEDEPFAYLALTRSGAATGGARILAPPRLAKPGITFKLCTEDGLEQRHIARRDGAPYKQARKRQWGGLL